MKNCDPFFPAQNFVFKFWVVNLNFQNKDLALLSQNFSIYKYLCTLIQTTSIVRLMVTKRALFDSPSNNLDWRSLAFFLLSHTPKRLHEWKIHKHSYLLITYICIYKKLFILHIPIFAATNCYLNAVKFSPIFSS